MNQLSGYRPMTGWREPFAGLPRLAAGDLSMPPERQVPSLPALAAACYLISVPLLSTWKAETSWIPQAIGIGVGVIWLVFGLLLGGRRVIWALPITLYLAWALWGATGLMVTVNTDYFFIMWGAILKVAAITWAISQCVRTRADLLICLLLLGLTSFLIFFLGVDVILKAAAFQGRRETVGSRAEGAQIGNANDLGVFGISVLISALIGFWACRSKFFKLLFVAPIPCALYIVAASGSRMVMIGVLLLGAGTYWFHLRKLGAGGVERKMAMLLIGAVLAGGSIYYVSNNPFFFRLKAAFADQNAIAEQPRTLYFYRGLKATAENPVFGLGLGGFALHGLGGRGAKAHFSHSAVTETLSCTGVPGFVLYFGSQIAFYLLVRKVRGARLPKQDASTVNMIMVAYWTFFIMSIVSVPMADRMIWPLHGAFCGYLVALKKRYVVAPLPVQGPVR